MNKQLQSKRKGSAIILVLFAVVILLVTGVGLLSLGQRSRVFAIRTTSDIVARCAADAGLTKALFEMNQTLKDYTSGGSSSFERENNAELENCDGTFTYKIVANSLSSKKDDYIIASKGKCGQAEKRVYAAVGLKSLFEFAIGAIADITLKAGMTIDGYNSADLSDTDIDVAIATNSTSSDEIVLNMGATVNGDVLVGVGGDPEVVIKDLGGTITGDSYAMTQEIEFPPITAPLLTDMGTGIYAKGTTLTIGPEQSGTYTDIDLKQEEWKETGTTYTIPSVLEIEGGDVVLYVTGDVWLANSCEIVVKPGSSLTLYLDGDLISGNDGGINNQNDPASFKLYGTGESQKIEIKAKGDFRGAVYAPDAFIFYHAWGDIYGSTLGYNVSIGTPSNFYYDEALRDASIGDEGVRFVVDRWSEE